MKKLICLCMLVLAACLLTTPALADVVWGPQLSEGTETALVIGLIVLLIGTVFLWKWRKK